MLAIEPHDVPHNPVTSPAITTWLLGVAALGGLYLASFHSYLLFHTLVEVFLALVGGAVFVLAWNTRLLRNNHYLTWLGIAFLFVSLLHVVHALAYKGMGIFSRQDANTPTQLWIATRYLHSLAFLAAPAFIRRRPPAWGAALGFAALTALLLAAIFYWGIFPDCFIEGRGLTAFKVNSEYAIIGIYLVAGLLLWRARESFDRLALFRLGAALALSMAAEAAFTAYVSVYGAANLLGHLLTVAAAYLIFRALVETGLRRPMDSLFRELKQRADDLNKSEDKFRGLFHNAQVGMFSTTLDGSKMLDVNEKFLEIFGRCREEALESPTTILWADPLERREVERILEAEGRITDFECRVLNSKGETRWCLASIKVHDNRGVREGSFLDITARKQAEEEINRLNKDLENRVVERTQTLDSTIGVLQTEIGARQQAEDRLHRLNRELRAISDCNQTLIRATDEQKLLEDVCRIICDQAGYRMAWVGLAENDEAKSVRPVAWDGVEDGYLDRAGITWADEEAGRGPTGTAIRTGQPCTAMDFASDPQVEPWREEALKRGYRSCVALPLFDGGGKAFGSLNIYSMQPNVFVPEETRLLEELAGDLAFGIVSLRARARQERMHDVNAARVRLLRFAAAHSLDELLEETINEAEALTGSLIGFYHFVEEDERTVWLQNWSTRTKAEFCQAEGKGLHYEIAQAGVWVDCLRQRRPVIHNDYASLPHRKGLPEGHAELVRELNVPVMRGERIKAILGVGNKAQPYTADDVEAVSLLADLAWEMAVRKQAEQALATREREYRTLAENLPSLVVRYDRQMRRIYVNPAWEKASGLSAGEVVNAPINAIPKVPSPVAEEYREKLQLALETGVSQSIEFNWVNAHGQTLYLHYVIVPEHDQKGEVVGLLAAGLDLTSHKQAEEALRESEQRFRAVMEQAADAFFLADEEGRMVEVNRAACSSLGYTREELLGLSVEDVDPRARSDLHREALWSELVPGKSLRLETEHRRKDGSIFPVELSLGLLERGGRRMVQGLARDITERKEQERERLERLHFVESLDRVNRALQTTVDLEQMTSDVLDVVLEVFDCDRAFLMYPCDPQATSWWVPMERTRPLYPGVNTLNLVMPMDEEVAETLRILLAADGPVKFGPSTAYPLPEDISKRFGFKTFMSMAIYPHGDKPWQFGVHQCSDPRIWTTSEERLLREIGRRLADALSALRARRDLQVSEERFRNLYTLTPAMLHSIDVQGNFLNVSNYWLEKMGYARNEVLGHSAMEFFTEESRRYAREVVWPDFFRTGVIKEIPYQVVTKDGRILDVLVSSVFERDEQGALLYSLSIVNDITERKRAEQALSRLNRELRAKSNCNQVMIRAADEQSLLEDICRIFCQEAGYRMAWVGYAENDEAKTVRPVAWAGANDGYLEAAKITWADTEHGRGPAGISIRKGDSVCIQDFSSDPLVAPWREAALQRGYRSALSLPLKDESTNTFGILVIYSSEPNAFTPDEARLLEEMGEDLAFGITALRTSQARMRAEEELRRSDARKTVLNQIAKIFLTVPDEDMFAEVLSVIIPFMQSQFGVFGYVAENGDLVFPSLSREVWDKCQVPGKSIVFPNKTWGNSLWGRAMLEKRAFFANYSFKTPPGHIPITNFLTVPVLFGERSIGQISVANKEGGYTDADRDLLEGIAASISPILNARRQRDIQERRRLEAEQALRESGERVSALINATTDSIILLDPQGAILAINEQGVLRRGLQGEKLEGKYLHEIMPPALAQNRQARIGEVVDSAQPAVFEEEWDGKSYLVRMFPVLDNKGKVRQIASFSRDVTEIKQADEERARLGAQLRQAQKMEAVGTLAGGIAHDFNNILSPIVGFTELVIENVDGQNREDLQKVLEASKRARSLINQILTLSRRAEQAKESVRIDLLIKETASLLRATVPKSIDIRYEIISPQVLVLGDPSQLHQVLMNLGTNAVQAMRGQKGKLFFGLSKVELGREQLALLPELKAGPYAVLTVRDSGRGMTPEVLERLFEPFFTTKPKGEGTGLGLSVVHGIIAQMDGAIRVESEPGRGSLFTIYLPALTDAHVQEDEFQTRAALKGAESILVVDDEQDILMVCMRNLESLGYSVTTACDGDDAIAIFRRQPAAFDLILTDLSMPGLTGVELAGAIRALHPSIPIVLSTGFLDDFSMERAAAAGIAGFLLKPYTSAKLAQVVRQALNDVKGGV